MKKLVECVPNFSEGRDQSKINDIVQHMSSDKLITVLDVDSGADTNRTVVTIVGPPKSIKEAAFSGIKRASEILDMSVHSGTHPRMGATDVCPFIPVTGVSDQECIDLSHEVGKRVGDELGIPVYFYEKSAKKSDRIRLPDIRKGEYEGLADKLANKNWRPDNGPSKVHIRGGATVIGCRDFLIAYNINLNTQDHRLATDIAFELREAGRSKRIPNPQSKNLLDGEIVRNKDGTPVKTKGIFKDIKAIGWYVDTFKCAQISINFNNYKVSTIHDVFDEACRLANERGVRVTGSELVGMIPLDAIIMAGQHYLKKQNRSQGVPVKDIVECAVQSLGLSDVVKFNPKEKIIDYAVTKEERPLVSMIQTEFIDVVSTNSPAPGGGSVSALAGSLGAALSSMVAALTHEKKGMLDSKPLMDEIGLETQKLKERLALLIDEDTEAFNKVLEANRLPSNSEDEKQAKKQAIEIANKYAIDIPLETAQHCKRVIEITEALVEQGSPSSVSDAGVAAEVALAGVRGACMNVIINLSIVDDLAYTQLKQKEVDNIIMNAERLHKTVYEKTISKIQN